MNRYNLKKSIGAMAVAVAASSLLVVSGFAQQTTVNFLGTNSPEWYAPVIESFEAAHPDIAIAYQQVPFNDLNAAIESRVGQGDSSIDIFEADTPRVPASAARGHLASLEDRRAAIEAAVPKPVDIEQVSHEGEIFAYPMWSSTQLLFFNRDLLKKAGVEMPSGSPEDRLTWAQLLEKAKAAQEGGAEWGVIVQQVDRYYQLQPLFESNGAGPGLSGDGLLEPDVTNDGWVSTAQWYQDIFENGIAPRGIAPNQTNALFTNGELAFLVGGPWVLGGFSGTDGLNFGVAPHPYFEGGSQVTPTGAWALGINPSAANKEAAQTFAEFITLTGDGSYLSISKAPFPPTNAEARERYISDLADMVETIGPVDKIISYELEETAVGRPRTIGFVAFETIMNRTFSDIRNGANVEEALSKAEAQISRAFNRL